MVASRDKFCYISVNFCAVQFPKIHYVMVYICSPFCLYLSQQDISSLGPLFNSANETGSMDHSWTFPCHVSVNSIHDAESMDTAFSADEFLTYVDEELAANEYWEPAIEVESNANGPIDWWRDLSRTSSSQVSGNSIRYTEPKALEFYANENLEYSATELNAIDPTGWWDHVWTSTDEDSNNSIHDNESVASAFSANEHLKYVKRDSSPNLCTSFPCSVPVDIAKKRWNVLFWILRWRFSVKRIVARNNRGKKPLLIGGVSLVPE